MGDGRGNEKHIHEDARNESNLNLCRGVARSGNCRAPTANYHGDAAVKLWLPYVQEGRLPYIRDNVGFTELYDISLASCGERLHNDV
jgi:hypothetical protein